VYVWHFFGRANHLRLRLANIPLATATEGRNRKTCTPTQPPPQHNKTDPNEGERNQGARVGGGRRRGRKRRTGRCQARVDTNALQNIICASRACNTHVAHTRRTNAIHALRTATYARHTRAKHMSYTFAPHDRRKRVAQGIENAMNVQACRARARL